MRLLLLLLRSLTYDDASWPPVHLHPLGVHPFAVSRLPHHVIGSLVALHAGIIQARREAAAARSLEVLVVLGLLGSRKRR